ncbi:SRPBCC family protein [Kutzneria chonburiensis]|uniref:SRPBCC family protein n=1 Tax=Kutzneria chonburiensis TaxID=1483604 RepID=A0ABV6MPN5_9PSEU|nr:SRPBCC family protein [Kutzneria chonburiensis]
MPSTDLIYTYVVPARPDKVFEHLADPANYVGLSPLVVKVYDVDETGYTAVERFRLGPVKYDNHIRVNLTVGDNVVASDVHSPGGVRMAHRFELSDHVDGCEIVERAHLTAPFGLVRFTAAQARGVLHARRAILTGRLEG